MGKNWYMVAYDIRNSKRLSSIAKLLKGYGHRLQYSIFRCRLSSREMEKLRWESKKILSGEDDFLIIELCKNCVSKIRKRCGKDAWPDDPPSFEII